MKTSYFGYFGPKINFIIHFFLEILYFKESCKEFGSSLQNQNFARYGIGNEISIALVFTLDYFQEKLMIFFKISKKPLFQRHLGPFLGKNIFWGIKGLCQFSNIPIIYHCAKNQKKTNSPFLRKMSN